MNYEIILAIAYLLFGGGWYMEACGEDNKDWVDAIVCVITMFLWPVFLVILLGMFVHRNLAK